MEYNKVNADLTTNVRGVDYEKWLPYVRDEVQDIPYIGDNIELTAEQDRIKMKAPIVMPTFRASIGIGFAFNTMKIRRSNRARKSQSNFISTLVLTIILMGLLLFLLTKNNKNKFLNLTVEIMDCMAKRLP